MTALNVDQLDWKEKILDVPTLNEVSAGKFVMLLPDSIVLVGDKLYFCFSALSTGLNRNFAEVLVEVVDCPDLTAPPYHLASSGLCGSTTIIDVGGPPFLLPLVDRTKIYDLKSLARKILPNANTIYLCGAGAGPHPLINSNCEVIVCSTADQT